MLEMKIYKIGKSLARMFKVKWRLLIYTREG